MSQQRTSLLRRSLRKAYPVAVRGEGAWIYSADERRYLDLAGSAAVNLIGHGDQDVARAIQAQMAALEFVHSSEFTTGMAEEFAREVLEFAGPSFADGAVFFTCGGSEAVESALKLARQYQVEIAQNQRTKILARKQSYHGSTFGAMSVSGNRKRREIYLPMLPAYPKVNTPYCYRCEYACEACATKYAHEVAQELQTAGNEIAAFIFEPISGATLGAATPPAGYLKAVMEFCEVAGVVTIADEVMTGFGRTGANFAVDHCSVAPDLLVVAKGIASGYAPLGAVIAQRRIVGAIERGSEILVNGLTYNAHPVSAAAGKAVLETIRKLGLVQAANSDLLGSIGAILKEALFGLMRCKSVGDVRGRGLLWGIEFVAERQSKKPFDPQVQFAASVAEAAMRRGLIVYPMQGCVDGMSGDHLLLAPPAIITREEIVWAAQQLAESIEEAEHAAAQ
jgi:adenosylmethionine-8-amino-7-oxononanoate aminotransferase